MNVASPISPPSSSCGANPLNAAIAPAVMISKAAAPYPVGDHAGHHDRHDADGGAEQLDDQKADRAADG